ncbi:MAG: hypothetical protein H6755_00875 [Candidatus Omnitrophica bacterium]|nr:hypothetical protein [Candidatus Omnitrophota bacterium]MCB9746942.1 hypothetical protein [Candidatus Omnitrophota bacterium]
MMKSNKTEVWKEARLFVQEISNMNEKFVNDLVKNFDKDSKKLKVKISSAETKQTKRI